MLSEQELATLHDEWVEYRYVDPISVVSKAHQDIHSLLDHIEAQEETLQEYRETLASQYAAIVEDNDLHQQLETAQAEAAAMRLAPTTTDHANGGQVPLDALAPLGLVSSEWKVLTEIDYLRADVQHLQDVAEAAKTILVTAMQACKGGYRGQPCPHGNLPTFPTHAWWCDPCFFALKERLEAAGYLREKADAE